MRSIIVMMLAGVFFYCILSPFCAAMEHRDFQNSLMAKDIKTAHMHIMNAIRLDPQNSLFNFEAANLYTNMNKFYIAQEYIDQAIVNPNGDLVPWGTLLVSGRLKMRLGNMYGAKYDFSKAIRQYPYATEAKRDLVMVNQIIAQGSLMIKYDK